MKSPCIIKSYFGDITAGLDKRRTVETCFEEEETNSERERGAAEQRGVVTERRLNKSDALVCG